MKTSLLKAITLLVLTTGGLHAQSFLGTWNQTSPAVTTGTDTNGTFVSTAPLNSSVTFNPTESSTSNPLFLWVPALSALRVGSFYNDTPSALTMGQYSVAMGVNSKASGFVSTALGWAYATGGGSTAIGMEVFASGTCSTAIGGGHATASGSYATAIGNFSTASGSYAMAIGNSAIASGTYATAMGSSTTANSYNSFVVGQYNLGTSASNGTPSTTGWVAEDPLLEVGNGSGPTAKSNALVVYKNGDIRIPKPQGDISMGEFAP